MIIMIPFTCGNGKILSKHQIVSKYYEQDFRCLHLAAKFLKSHPISMKKFYLHPKACYKSLL